MAYVNDHHQQLMPENFINDPVSTHAVRIAAFELPFEGFTLEGIVLEIIQNLRHAAVEFRFEAGQMFENGFRLAG